MSLNRLPLFLIFLAISALPVPALAVMPKISVGGDYMLLLKSDGTVWAWGYNSGGSLGTGNRDIATSPVKVVGLTGVIDVVAAKNGAFSMALKADGAVWVWGNISGGLSGAMTSGGVFSSVPVQIPSLHNIVSIEVTADGAAAFAIDISGKVWSWGSDSYGELGDGRLTAKRGVPEPVASLTDVVQVSATGDQIIALRSDGSALGWGQYYNNGDNLLLGLPANAYVIPTAMNVPKLAFLQAVNSNTSGLFMGIDGNGTVMTWGDTNSGLLTCHQNVGNASLSSLPKPYYPAGLNNIQQIAGGSVFALFLDKSGTVLGCGNNSYGQLGDGSTVDTTTASNPPKYGPVITSGLPQDIVYIATGAYASAAISSQGGVFTWGRADSGLSGVANQSVTKNSVPVKVSVDAGARATAPATFAGTQNGPINNATIDVGLSVAPEHVGSEGEIYFAVLLPNGQMLLLNASGNWVAYDPAKLIVPMFKGSLPAKLPIFVGEKMNLTGFEGAVVILGYGLGNGANANADLLGKQRYSSVLTLN